MIKINITGFSPDFRIDIRELLADYSVTYTDADNIIIQNEDRDRDLVSQLEQWDIMLERL